APRRIRQRLGAGGSDGPGGAHGAGDGKSLSQQCAAIDQAVAGDVIERWRAPSASPLPHDFLPDGWRHMHLAHAVILRHDLPTVHTVERPWDFGYARPVCGVVRQCETFSAIGANSA